MAESEAQRMARIAQEEATWTGPKFMALLAGTLVFAIFLIYLMASYRGDTPWDLTWYPFGTTPKAEDLKPSSVSGLVR